MRLWEREQSIKTCLNQFGADWVKIEMEPALQYKQEVNFPWLIDILKSKAGHGESAFVFGEDNVGFALAFIDSPVYAVCIERDGDKYQEYKDKIAKHNIKFTYLTGNNHKHESSTRIRSEGK